MLSLRTPIISAQDPPTESEGSVDPLALQVTYERLADNILPAVTVRMRRIRFLTAMCLGAFVCRSYRDQLASDDVTPPWLVFEWFVVEAFARTLENRRGGERIAGLQKVRAVVDRGLPVSHATYLKTPKVFGFSGILRRLATKARVLDADLELDDLGMDLLAAWAKDQGLDGLTSDRGPGRDFVAELRDAVEKGLAAHTTVKRPGIFWANLAGRLHPDEIGTAERRVLGRALRGTHGLTEEHLAALIRHREPVYWPQEATYLRNVTSRASQELRTHLEAIDVFEGICRPISDAFLLLRHLSTARGHGPVDAKAFSAAPDAPRLVAQAIQACRTADERSALFGPETFTAIRKLIDGFDHVRDADGLFMATIEHHLRAQRAKRPEPRRPWLEPAGSGAFMVRPAYAVPELDDVPPYVHDYRTGTLSGFLDDLKWTA